MNLNDVDFELLNENDYPTEECLYFIEHFEPENVEETELFINTILKPCWYNSEWGVEFKRKYAGSRTLILHTGGWSGNEDIIGAILNNFYLKHTYMKYVKWTIGGHYYFDVTTMYVPKENKDDYLKIRYDLQNMKKKQIKY